MRSSSAFPLRVPNESDFNVYLYDQVWVDSDDAGTDVVLVPWNASASAEVRSLDDINDDAAPLAGPVVLTCIDAAKGLWRGRIPADALVVGEIYKIVSTIVVANGPQRTYTTWIMITETDA